MKQAKAVATKETTAPKKEQATALVVEVIAGIEGDLERWRSRRPAMETALGVARDELAELKKRRDGLLLAAIDNSQAQQELGECRNDLAAAERKAEELAATLAELDKRLAALTVELAGAQREKALIDLRGFAAERLEIAAEIDKALTPIPDLLRRWRAAAGSCSSLAAAAGLGATGHGFYRPDTLAAAIAWKFSWLFPGGLKPSASAGTMGEQLRQPFRCDRAAVVGADPRPGGGGEGSGGRR